MTAHARVRFASAWLAMLVIWSVWPEAARAQTQEDFFRDDVLQDLQLTVSVRDWDALKARVFDDTYYTADLRWRGSTVRNVGIRSRGLGSRVASKPGLRVDVNRYLAGQEFLGLKAFVLDNAATDPSLLRESLTMKLFARMSVPAPREAHVRLWVNDEYVGVYVIVESIDRTFVSRVFGEDEGDVEKGGFLFEYHWNRPYGFEYLGPALEPYAELFTPQTHDTDSIARLYAPLEGMIRAINESRDDRFVTEVGAVLDLPALIGFLAVQSFVAEIDGMVGAWGMNNFYVYRFRSDAPSRLIPWDADHAFSWPDLPVDSNMPSNVLTRRLMATPELRGRFIEALIQVSGLASQPGAADPRGWLERELDRQAGLIAAAVAADPVLPYSYDDFVSEVETLRRFAQVRPLYVGCVLDADGAQEAAPFCAGQASDTAENSALRVPAAAR